MYGIIFDSLQWKGPSGSGLEWIHKKMGRSALCYILLIICGVQSYKPQFRSSVRICQLQPATRDPAKLSTQSSRRLCISHEVVSTSSADHLGFYRSTGSAMANLRRIRADDRTDHTDVFPEMGLHGTCEAPRPRNELGPWELGRHDEGKVSPSRLGDHSC